MSKKLFTIFTPLYNHEPYLDEYFDGLLRQTYRELQIIVIDDGSTDGSWKKAKSYEAALREAFPHVLLESHPNIGPSQELIRALDHVKGDYFSILESDDYYLPTRIEEHVHVYETQPNVGCIHGESDYVYGSRIEARHWEHVGRRIPSGDIFDALLLDNFVMMCSFSCRTDLFRRHVNMAEYITKGYVARDYAIFLDLARHTSFAYLDKSLVRYRVLTESFSHTRNPQVGYDRERMYHQIKLDYIEKYGGPERARELAIEGLHHAEFLYALRMQESEKCQREYEWLVEHNPALYGRLLFRLQAFSARHPLVGKAMRWVEEQPAARRSARSLFPRRPGTVG